MAKIAILILGHLCNAPRPQKEAAALARAGHEVTIHGAWFSNELARRDELLLNSAPYKFRPFADFRPGRGFSRFCIRFRNRLARELFLRTHRFSPELLGYAPKAMLGSARVAKADLTIVHSEAGLWVGEQLLKEGFKVGVDFEDWFSEDLLPEARRYRPIQQLKQFEQTLLRQCRYSLATSEAMADALAKAYDAPKPKVIYNSFPWRERQHLDGKCLDRKKDSIPSLHWFSQTIGPGRGLETLMQALPQLKSVVEIHLRGNYPESSKRWLEPLIPHSHRKKLFIHETVPNHQLLSRIAEHDIGLAIERVTPTNRDVTVTNKLFQYLLGGLAVIATATAGQTEILNQCPSAGALIPPEDAKAMAQAIDKLVLEKATLESAKSAALAAAQNQFCWEKQEKALLGYVASALE